ncbi:MAG: hypothetical protein R3C03_13230 [Pirellulaceae bacterium]
MTCWSCGTTRMARWTPASAAVMARATAIGSGNDAAGGVTVRSDGSIVVVGKSQNGNGR